MDSLKEAMKHIPEKSSGDDVDVMLNPDYVRQSGDVVTEALKKGFDVLQLENGDIVTTGTKIVVTHYQWDRNKNALVKLSDAARKKLDKTKGKKKK